MSPPHPFHIVDVFAESRYAGNQLAVVFDAADIPTDEMQRIAAETNFSETTFVLAREPGPDGFPVRIFTPTDELPFAGHPTLGTAWMIRRTFAAGAGEVRLALGVGSVPVRFEEDGAGGELCWLTAPPVEFGETCDPGRIAAALGLEEDDIDPKTPPQQLAVGLTILVVPLRRQESLRRCRLDLERFAPLAAEGFQPYVLVFCPEPHDAANDLCARFFFDARGVREDPATGSANACLGAYLVRHRYFGSAEVSVDVEQGHEIARPSLLRVRAAETADGIVSRVGGRVIEVSRGELL